MDILTENPTETQVNGHTPGPWYLQDRGTAKGGGHSICPHCKKRTYEQPKRIDILAKADNEIRAFGVASVQWMESASDDFPIATANARLIAAAPDLLAALDAVLPLLPSEAEMLNDTSLNEGRAGTFGIAGVKVRAAIAKARGGQP